MSVFDSLTRDEAQQLDARIFVRWKCPTDAKHDPASERDCFACEAVRIFALIDQQDEPTNDVTWEARRVLYDYCEKVAPLG